MYCTQLWRHVIFALISQGTFTHWRDDSPLENMDWNSEDLSYQWPSAISVLTKHISPKLENISRTITSILKLLNIPKQPESNLHRNCTGVFTIIGCRARGWVTISCKEQFYTSFVCVSRSRLKMGQDLSGNSWMPSNLTCHKDWLLIGGRCLTFLQPSHDINSFQKAHSTCQAKGGMLLSITHIPQLEQTKIRILEYAAVLERYNNVDFYTLEEISMKMSGVPLKYNYSHPGLSHVLPLLEMLPFMTVKKPLILPVFEILSATCWMLELGYLQSMPDSYQNDFNFNKDVHWGLKAIECKNTFGATTFVCERSPHKLYTSCLTGHFTCDDSTCILSVYVCDGLDDCLNGEDERGCPRRNYTTKYGSDMKLMFDSMIVCSTTRNCTSQDELITYDNVHSLCDGLHICNVINEQLCSYRNLNHIQITHRHLFQQEQNIAISETHLAADAALPFTGNDPYDKTLDLAERHASFSLRKINLNKSLKHLEIETNQHTSLETLLLPCQEMGTLYSVYDYCVIHSTYPCTHGKYSDICRHVLCPGMFKCRQYGCIRLSSICDGQADCPLSEDESDCFNMSCPGVVKCRNENRCIGREQICDGISDCMYSSDDEIMCNKCPDDCRCVGYTMQCDDIQADMYKLNESNHAKVIILKGHIHSLYLEDINTNLISLDVSLCKMHSVLLFSSNVDLQTTNILFSNFSDNKIKTDFFLINNLFSNLVVLDLSNNLLSVLVNSSLVNLKHLKILKLDRNPIIYTTLTILKHFPRLWKLNIESIYLLETKVLPTEARDKSHLEITTHDALFCCLLTHDVRCVTPVFLKCYGFINNLYERISIWVLTVLTCIILLSSSGNYLHPLVKQGLKNALFLALFNMGISDVLSVIYICSIVAADWQQVNIVHWQTGDMCKILQILVILSLISNIILRCTAALILFLKIEYPFKHQCRWLKYTWFICVSIWLLSIIYAHFMSRGYLYSHSVFCTHWCQGADRLLPLKISMSIIEVICIFILILFVKMAAMSLKSNIVTSSHLNLHTTFRVIFPLTIEICTVGLFRLLSIYVFMSESLDNIHTNILCIGITCFIMPIKIIICLSARSGLKYCFRCFGYR